ncbi:hypothetical protein B0O99DRAFT_614310 [Bisporella sp. PMI_857]|nr:hypothetical protein B0O99DRAFT_614310 [Bisporella sp. PMI_857]
MPLQKSFSDTNYSSKRQPWKRNRSYQGQHPSKTGPPMKPLQEKPPLPVSTSTKNKLAVFEFRGQSENDKPTNPPVISLLSSDEKENGSPIETELQQKQNDTKSLSDLLTAEESSTSFPSTPAGRLALPDLIEMGDVKREVQGVSPEDRIEWDQRSSASPFGIRRAKKRARSSSPASSPAAKASDHLNSRGEPLDPGSELWGRYSLGNLNMHTPQGALIPALANIMFTSSPQPSRNGTPRSGSTLRRTNSCGTSFPKRRRIGGPENADVITESVNIGPSKLSVLIQTVQRGFTPSKPLVVEANPHKSSRDQEKSPSCKKYQAPIDKLQMDQGPSQQVARIQTLNKPELMETSPSAQSHASDYGEFDDEDLDASLLDAFVRPDVPFNASEESTSGSAYEPSLGRGANTQLVPLHPLVRNSKYPNRRIPSPIKPKVVQLPSTKPEGDEFDDSDEDLFAAGLDDMVACFSKKEENKAGSPAPKLALNSRSPQKRRRVVADSDDEFGDNELDDNDFEVAEKAATQAIQQSSQSLLPVRTQVS